MSKKHRFESFKNIITSVFHKMFAKNRRSSLIDSVSELIKEHGSSTKIGSEEIDILENFVDFGELKASEVMIPRTNMIGVPHNASYKEVKEILLNSGHTRFPVYKDSIDSVIGFLHVKDYMHCIDKPENFSINKIMREAIYVPRAMRAVDLLGKMRRSGTHIAIVLDEYGGTDGLITIGDVVEEIIGDIRDEHDSQVNQTMVVPTASGALSIDGRADIEEVEEHLGVSLSEEDGDYETFGGFVMSFLGRIPVKGEKFSHPSGINIEITEGDVRHISRAIVEKTPSANSEF